MNTVCAVSLFLATQTNHRVLAMQLREGQDDGEASPHFCTLVDPNVNDFCNYIKHLIIHINS